jgi:hypothetical protein
MKICALFSAVSSVAGGLLEASDAKTAVSDPSSAVLAKLYIGQLCVVSPNYLMGGGAISGGHRSAGRYSGFNRSDPNSAVAAARLLPLRQIGGRWSLQIQ